MGYHKASGSITSTTNYYVIASGSQQNVTIDISDEMLLALNVEINDNSTSTYIRAKLTRSGVDYWLYEKYGDGSNGKLSKNIVIPVMPNDQIKIWINNGATTQKYAYVVYGGISY